MKRSLVLVSLVTVGVPITVVLGSLGVYFLLSGIGAFTTSMLGMAGQVQQYESPLSLLLMAPAMAAIGVLALAGVAGYVWLSAIVMRGLRHH